MLVYRVPAATPNRIDKGDIMKAIDKHILVDDTIIDETTGSRMTVLSVI